MHKQKLLKKGAQEPNDADAAYGNHQEAEEDLVRGKDDSLYNEDLTYITAILGSFSRQKIKFRDTKRSKLRHIDTRGCAGASASAANAAAKI